MSRSIVDAVEEWKKKKEGKRERGRCEDGAGGSCNEGGSGENGVYMEGSGKDKRRRGDKGVQRGIPRSKDAMSGAQRGKYGSVYILLSCFWYSMEGNMRARRLG